MRTALEPLHTIHTNYMEFFCGFLRIFLFSISGGEHRAAKAIAFIKPKQNVQTEDSSLTGMTAESTTDPASGSRIGPEKAEHLSGHSEVIKQPGETVIFPGNKWLYRKRSQKGDQPRSSIKIEIGRKTNVIESPDFSVVTQDEKIDSTNDVGDDVAIENDVTNDVTREVTEDRPGDDIRTDEHEDYQSDLRDNSSDGAKTNKGRVWGVFSFFIGLFAR